MKRKLFLAAMASAAALLVGSSCSREADIDEGGPTGESSGFSLRIQTPKGAYITRAVVGAGHENAIDNILLYAFDENDNMVGTTSLVEGTDYTASEDSGITTIEFEDAWLSKVAGKEIVFYAIANHDTGNGTTVTDLVSGTPPTTKAAFEALVSDVLPDVEPDTWVDEEINTELLMTAQTEPIEIVGDATAQLSLKRRIARFDIVNPMAASGDGQIVITNIQAFNAPTQGNVFASGPADFVPDRANYDFLTCGAGQGGAFNLGNPKWSAMAIMDRPYGTMNGAYLQETDKQGEITWRLPGAFYMFPTKLNADPKDGGMNIYIEATQNGNVQIYVPSNDVEIKANYRYTFTLHPPTLTFTIEVADFDEGSVMNTEPGRETKDIGVSAVPEAGMEDNVSDIDGDFAIYYANNIGDQILTFEVETELGSDLVFESVYDGFPIPAWVDNTIYTKTTEVYHDTTNGRSQVDKYVVTIPGGATSTDNPFVIRVKQKYGEKERKAYFVSDTDLDDIFSDPSHQGFLDMINTNTDTGLDAKFFPLILDNITNLVQDGMSGGYVENIEGLKYMSKLEFIDISQAGFSTNVTSVDLTHNPKLRGVTLSGGPNVASITIASESPFMGDDMNYLYLNNYPSLTSLDLSKYPTLEYIMGITNCPLLKTLDLRYNRDLVTLEGGGMDCHLENILFEGEYDKLGAINLSNSAITSLDFSRAEMSLHNNFDISDTKNLQSIKFPATPGLVTMDGYMILAGTSLTKVDVTNITFGASGQMMIVNSDITELAFDPRVLKRIDANDGTARQITLYIPDDVYDTLDLAGKLDVDGLNTEHNMGYLDSGNNNVTFAKYSTYIE